MATAMILKLATIAFTLFAIFYAIRKAGTISSAISMVIALPGTVILRGIVLIATLPAAFTMMTAEKDLASLMGKEADAAQIEQIRLKMARSARTAWFNGQTDNGGTSDAFRLARAFA